MALGPAIRHLKHGDWQKAHALVQTDETTFGCWAHGIAHMMEGDYGNARYWYRRAHRSYPSDNNAAAELSALARAWKDQTTPKEGAS
jgi:hypothetical protein